MSVKVLRHSGHLNVEGFNLEQLDFRSSFFRSARCLASHTKGLFRSFFTQKWEQESAAPNHKRRPERSYKTSLVKARTLTLLQFYQNCLRFFLLPNQLWQEFLQTQWWKAATATRRWHNANNPDRSTLMWLIKLLPQLKFVRGVQILPWVSSVTLKPSRLTSRSRLATVLSWTSQSSGCTPTSQTETSAVPHWVEQAAPSGSSI